MPQSRKRLVPLLLMLAPLYTAFAAEEITGPEADSSEPVRVYTTV